MFVAISRKIVRLPFVIFACALWWLSPGHAQEVDHDIPANAHYAAGQQGWACNRGYTQISGLCMEDSAIMPSDGAFEYSDGQWRCRSGYHRAGKYCVPGVAPEHASFVGDGEHWECDWGFRKIGAGCQEIKPPAHAYIEATGRDWVCFPGFGRVLDRCVPMSSAAPKEEATTTPQ